MRAQEDVIDLCVRNFTSPRATTASVDRRVFRSPVNLGIAGNYRRAENYIFEVLACQSALLLEDDLVLGPHYLTAVAGLLDIAAEETRIGYVSAYGDLWATLERQRAGVDRLMPMHENWGAALTRTSWLAQKPIREQYWEFVKDIDYSQRDNAAIRAFYASLGYRCEITSQDASRWIACRAAGLVRIMTKTCHARYVGVIGEHSTRDFYERWKFGEFDDISGAASRQEAVQARHRQMAEGGCGGFRRRLRPRLPKAEPSSFQEPAAATTQRLTSPARRWRLIPQLETGRLKVAMRISLFGKGGPPTGHSFTDPSTKGRTARGAGDRARDLGDWSEAARFYAEYLSVEPKRFRNLGATRQLQERAGRL